MFSRIQNIAHKRGGFTMIELMMCVVIIAVLVGISLWNYGGNVEEAELARAKRDMALIHEAASQYRAQMGPGSIDTVVSNWCSTLTSTKTSPDGGTVGPWLGSCPVAPHKGGVFAVTKTNDYVSDVTYTYSGKTIKLSTLK